MCFRILQLYIAFLIILIGCTKDENAPPYETGTVKDYEGNSYKTVKIGEQWWMAENLASTRLNDGTELPNVTDDSEWAESSNPAYCWYDNDESNKRIYGALYNEHAVKTGKLCPTGWHIPDSSDLKVLIDVLGGSNIAGAKLKETGIEYWKRPNWGANNQTGFSARASGRRLTNGSFVELGSTFFMWSLNEAEAGRAIGYRGVSLYSFLADTNYAHSVRCVKD